MTTLKQKGIQQDGKEWQQWQQQCIVVVVTNIGFTDQEDTWIQILAPSLLDKWLCICYIISLSFSFLTCKLGIISLSSYGSCKIYLRIYKQAFGPMDNKHSAYSSYYDTRSQSNESECTRAYNSLIGSENYSNLV